MRDKLRGEEELKKIVCARQKTGHEVVFTNGCFDLLHIGHVRYLYQARSYGDILVVAVNSDYSVRQLKGKDRPIIGQKERAELIAALEMVDYVNIFNQLTCINLLQVLKPDIYVKGGDYTPETLPEWSTVKKYGGRIELVREIKGRSTSKLIEKIDREGN